VFYYKTKSNSIFLSKIKILEDISFFVNASSLNILALSIWTCLKNEDWKNPEDIEPIKKQTI